MLLNLKMAGFASSLLEAQWLENPRESDNVLPYVQRLLALSSGPAGSQSAVSPSLSSSVHCKLTVALSVVSASYKGTQC